MARCPLVRPDTDTLTLSDGETITVKKRLTAGEYHDMISGQYKENLAGGFGVDLTRVGIQRVLAYLTEWSYVDFDGKPLKVIESEILAIDPDDFAEIREAIDAHHAKSEADAEAKKKTRAGARVFSTT